MKINIIGFCDVTPFSLVDRYKILRALAAFILYCPEAVGIRFLRNAIICKTKRHTEDGDSIDLRNL
jgi:hypothetical protein